MKNFIIQYFSFIGTYKRFLIGLFYSVITKKSYSQHGEDLVVSKLLTESHPENLFYIDVGCNHPMVISNTFLLYSKGAKGICIDANKEFRYLYKLFRRRDIFLPIGIGSFSELAKFYISKTPVISGFEKSLLTKKVEFVPILTLDNVCKNLSLTKVDFLNIDVEGLNFDVLKGSVLVLSITKIICIEYDDEDEKSRIISFLENEFNLIEEIACNLIFRRK